MLYAIYLILLSLYILDKNEYGLIIQANNFTRILNWYVQISYHIVYILFTGYFLNFFKHFPSYLRKTRIYIYSLLALGLIFFAYTYTTKNVELYISYFTYVHVPLVVIGLAFGMYKILKVREPMVAFYIPGLIFYIVFSLYALHLTLNPSAGTTLSPISYLYIGILIETTVFAIGLGYQTQQFYANALRVEKELAQTQLALQQKLQIQLDQKSAESALNQLKVSSLQGQMNSHFIFNVLSGIKSYIIENNPKAAVSYLNKYAKLVREFLNGSNIASQSIAKEISTAQLYIELENMRLDYTLDIEMEIDDSINLNTVQIPTHILIPLIENAIWNGLYQVKYQKKLGLRVTQDKDSILVNIIDNGDYSNPKEKAKLNANFGKGMQLVEEKIASYNQVTNSQVSYVEKLQKDGGLHQIVIPQPSSFKIQL